MAFPYTYYIGSSSNKIKIQIYKLYKTKINQSVPGDACDRTCTRRHTRKLFCTSEIRLVQNVRIKQTSHMQRLLVQH